jgi:hypothetical protein
MRVLAETNVRLLNLFGLYKKSKIPTPTGHSNQLITKPLTGLTGQTENQEACSCLQIQFLRPIKKLQINLFILKKSFDR